MIACPACTLNNCSSSLRCEACRSPLSQPASPDSSLHARFITRVSPPSPLLPAHKIAGMMMQNSRSVSPSPPSPLPLSSGSLAAAVDLTPEESALRSLLDLTDLLQLQHVAPGADAVQELREHIRAARYWWERMEQACDCYLSREQRKQVLAAVNVDVVFQHWPDARCFTDGLRGATDLPAFLVQCHRDNATTAAALCETEQLRPSRSRSMQELQQQSPLYRLRDSWLRFQQLPTVFHASRFYSYWTQLRLKNETEERRGGSPISGPLTAGGYYCLQQALPVCRSIIEKRIAALHEARRMNFVHVVNQGGSLQINSPYASAAISAPLQVGNSAANNGAFSIAGRDSTVAGGNMDNRGASTVNVSVRQSVQLCPITSLLTAVPYAGSRDSRVTAAFQPESELDESSAQLIRDVECQTQEGRVEHNLLALGFTRSLQRVMSSVVMLTNVVMLQPYDPTFDPGVVNDEFISQYGGGFAVATAFLISPRLLLTNYHVFPAAAAAGHEETLVCFDFDGDAGDGRGESGCAVGVLQPADFFFCDRELDFAVVAFRYPDDEYEDAAAAQPVLKDGKRRPPLLLRKAAAHNAADSRLVIVGHPEGKAKQLSMPGVLLRSGAARPQHPHYCLYTNDTQRGSSGSPILDMRWQLIGLHHSALRDGRNLLHSLSGKQALYNQGTVASAIFDKLLALYAGWQAAPTADCRAAMELLRACLAQDPSLPLATKAILRPSSAAA